MNEFQNTKWRFAVDRGGTFTDIIGLAPSGKLVTQKLLSDSDEYDDPGIEGIRRILGIKARGVLPSKEIAWIRMGTTVATNALLERRGARTGLLITKGFRDILEIGTQDRPDIFALAIHKPDVLYDQVAEIDERLDSNGNVITQLDPESVDRALIDFKEKGVESIAIAFLFSWINPEHEILVRDACRNNGFENVSTSHETMPVIQIVHRGRTTLVDAYLAPAINKYLEGIKQLTGKIPVYMMSSTGSLFTVDKFTGKDSIMSGPAGGVLGAATVSGIANHDEIIGFDMGGTSTDVCRYAGSLQRVLEVEAAGVKFTTPMLEIQTVASGGGSVLGFDGRKLTVGPESAGAIPGPACYGRGGPASITDANLVLGRLHPDFFPKVFGPKMNQGLDSKASRKALRRIAARVEKAQGIRMSVEKLALGYIRVANETMCRPIKELSVSRGHDPRTHGLVAFGGAGAQHACGIAQTLGIRKILIPQQASLLSAFGMLFNKHRKTSIETRISELNDDNLGQIKLRADEIAQSMKDEIIRETGGIKLSHLATKIDLDIRTPGTDIPLTLEYSDQATDLIKQFSDMHLVEHGFAPHDVIPEIVNLRVEVFEKEKAEQQMPKRRSGELFVAPKMSKAWFRADKPEDVLVYKWDYVDTEMLIPGPALIVSDTSTVVVEPGFEASIDDYGIITLTAEDIAKPKASVRYDPVLLEVFHHLFMGIAEQMGRVLQRTAHSVNVKERLDFSCAVFDSNGNLVANAPHIPVHLGAMGETVKSLIESTKSEFNPGDFYCSNDPYSGGSHLPDITVVAPVFSDGEIRFYLAARGHHADIGGVTPGSMHPFAKSLSEEGIVLRNQLLVRKGEFLEDKIISALSDGEYPARNIPERLSDLRAQVAAVQKGITEIENLCEQYSDEIVAAYMEHIRDDAESAMHDALENFLRKGKSKEYKFTDHLDNGARIEVSISIDRNESGKPIINIDFAGTDPALESSLNAPPAVTQAAVLYVFRTLINRPIPLNDGCMKPVRIIIPEGSLLNPPEGHAVCGGNVETSQRIVDCLYGALGVAAASQGTMNNLAFGYPDSKGAQYYETIAGGSGAVDGFDGASAVQVHMTNTRITDPEVLEIRFPQIHLDKFFKREGSGGDGKFKGGDGIIRAYKFLESQMVTILSERRKKQPFGLHGGDPGRVGENLLISPDGSIEKLDGHFQGVIDAGATLEIRTPGGGGYGEPG